MEMGIFNSLENLEKSSIQRRDEKLAKEEENARVEKKLEILKGKRDEILQKVKKRNEALEALKTCEGNIANIGEDTQNLLLKLETQRLGEILTAYRLTGTTVEVVDENRSRLRFDLCYKGEFVKAFYAELNTKGDSFHISRHSLPEFIPQEMLEQKLESGIREFCSCVHSFLRAFIARRQETFTVQENYSDYLRSEICSSPSFDYIELSLSNCDEVSSIQLIYDLKSIKPKEVVLKGKDIENEDMKEQMERFEKDLHNLPLSDVFHTYFIEDQMD